MRGNKVINAGFLINQIIEIYTLKEKSSFQDLTEEERNDILFSLGFPNSESTLKIEW